MSDRTQIIQEILDEDIENYLNINPDEATEASIEEDQLQRTLSTFLSVIEAPRKISWDENHPEMQSVEITEELSVFVWDNVYCFRRKRDDKIDYIASIGPDNPVYFHIKSDVDYITSNYQLKKNKFKSE